MQILVHKADIHESGIEARDKELARTIQMNAGGGSGGKSAMPQFRKFNAPRLAGRGVREDLFRLKIHKPQPHGALAHDPFQVAASAATAEMLFGIKRDNRVARFPKTVAMWVAAVSNTGPERPHPDQAIQVPAAITSASLKIETGTVPNFGENAPATISCMCVPLNCTRFGESSMIPLRTIPGIPTPI